MQSMRSTREEALSYILFYSGLNMVEVDLPDITNRRQQKQHASTYLQQHKGVDFGKDVNAALIKFCTRDEDRCAETPAKQKRNSDLSP